MQYVPCLVTIGLMALFSTAHSASYAKLGISALGDKSRALTLSTDHCQAIKITEPSLHIDGSIQMQCQPTSSGQYDLLIELFTDDACLQSIERTFVPASQSPSANVTLTAFPFVNFWLMEHDCSGGPATSAVTFKVSDSCAWSAADEYIDIALPDNHCMSLSEFPLSMAGGNVDTHSFDMQCCASDGSLAVTLYAESDSCVTPLANISARLSADINGECFVTPVTANSSAVFVQSWTCQSFVNCDAPGFPEMDFTEKPETCDAGCLKKASTSSTKGPETVAPAPATSTTVKAPTLQPTAATKTTSTAWTPTHGFSRPSEGPDEGFGGLDFSNLSLADLPDISPLQEKMMARLVLNKVSCDPSDKACSVSLEFASDCSWDESDVYVPINVMQGRCLDMAQQLRRINENVTIAGGSSMDIKCCSTDNSLLISSYTDERCSKLDEAKRLAPGWNGKCLAAEYEGTSGVFSMSWTCEAFEDDCEDIMLIDDGVVPDEYECHAGCVGEAGLSAGVIVMYVVVGVVGLLVVLAIVGCVRKRKVLKRENEINMAVNINESDPKEKDEKYQKFIPGSTGDVGLTMQN